MSSTSSSRNSGSSRSSGSGRTSAAGSRTGGSGRDRSYRADSVYIEGNTVRTAEAVPERKPEQPQRSRREIREQREREQAANRNLERAMALGHGYVAFLTLATAICFVVCLTFIHLQSGVSEHMSTIATMETALSNQRAANDLAESRLETSMTLDEVKARAEDMGLVYPTTSQIQYFTVESSDYMNQYTDVASR